MQMGTPDSLPYPKLYSGSIVCKAKNFAIKINKEKNYKFHSILSNSKFI